MRRFLFISLIFLGLLALLGAIFSPWSVPSAFAGDPLLDPRQEQPTPTSTLESTETLEPEPTDALEATPTVESKQPQPFVAAWDQALLSDGQFVWGPNVGDFDIAAFLEQRGSPLAPDANLVEGHAAYAGINPRVLLTVLELQHGLVTSIPDGMEEASLAALIEQTSMALHLAFYQHLYQWGSRADAAQERGQPTIALADGVDLPVAAGISSGSFAVANVLGNALPSTQAEVALAAETQDGFGGVFNSFFPDVDPLDTSNDINADAPPPDDLFQFPFPLNASWRFSGAHSWCGGDKCGTVPDRSSMDFMTTWSNFPNFPFKNTVAAAEGSVWIYTPTQDPLPCWININHGGGWSTSYYHLINIGSNSGAMGILNQNQLVGSIGTETCNDGFATGAHVHFTLWYNGALADLEGIKLSGWDVHVDYSATGNDTYSSGYIERDGVILTPYSTVLNDYYTYYGDGLDYSLRFFGNSNNDIDRVKIPLQDFDNAQDTGPMTDLGIFDFSAEWWMKANPGANLAPAITCGANDNWKDGNLLFDRSRGTNTHEWGVSIAGGRIAFGVTGSSGQKITLCSTATIDDGAWHHILIQRNRYDSSQGYLDGQLWLFVDGVLQQTAVGPTGNISYPDSATPGSNCGATGSQTCSDDPYLVIGASKYDIGYAFNGWLDDLRVSGWIRHLADFTPPSQPLQPDSLTVAMFSFNEGSGDIIFDTGGYDGGASTGNLHYGGSPAGPVWTTIVPYIEYEYIYLPLIMR